MSRTTSKLFYIRYLAPKSAGLGEIVHVISTSEELTIERYRELHPEVFTAVGFYTMHNTVGYLTVEPPKK